MPLPYLQLCPYPTCCSRRAQAAPRRPSAGRAAGEPLGGVPRQMPPPRGADGGPVVSPQPPGLREGLFLLIYWLSQLNIK